MKTHTVLTTAALLLFCCTLSRSYAQGISSIEELRLIGNDPAYPLNGSYWLTQDIDASATALWNDAATDETLLEGFKPIGDIGGWDDVALSWTNGLPFEGILNGNGHVIQNLTINRPDQLGVGLFSSLGAGAIVTNLNLAGGTVVGSYPVGGLAGLSAGTVGGCGATCAVTGLAYVGGLIGRMESGDVRGCFATGPVSGVFFSIGGLIGDIENGDLDTCYATGAVDGDSAVGGLVGSNYGTIETCYAAGAVTAFGTLGGLVAEGFGTVTGSYWDTSASGQAASMGGEGKATPQMRQQATFAGWNFSSVWSIMENAGYPYLSANQNPAPTYLLSLDAQGGVVAPAVLTVLGGQAYGTLPTPMRPEYTFGGWRTAPGGAGLPITAATLVTATANHTLYALWSANGASVPAGFLCPEMGDALTTVGAYTGYFYAERAFGDRSTMAVRGTLALTVSGLAGKMTAKVVTQAATITFRAAAWTTQQQDGTYRATLQSRGGEVLDLSVRQDRITGVLAGGKMGAEMLQLEGARNRFDNTKDMAAQTALNGYRGYYTVSFPVAEALPLGAAQNMPEGSGYLTLTIGNKGSVKIAGVLADGTRFTQASSLVLFNGCGPEVCVPFFVPLNFRRGWTGGLFWITPGSLTVVTEPALGWLVRWENQGSGPDGFSTLLATVGGFYDTTPSLEAHYLFSAATNDVSYAYVGGTTNSQAEALPDDINVTVSGTRMTMARGTRPVFANGAYDYSAENSPEATLRFTSRTGLFKGNFNLYYDYTENSKLRHMSVRVPYVGVLTRVRDTAFSTEPAGQGYYLVPDSNSHFKSLHLKRSFKIELDAGS